MGQLDGFIYYNYNNKLESMLESFLNWPSRENLSLYCCNIIGLIISFKYYLWVLLFEYYLKY